MRLLFDVFHCESNPSRKVISTEVRAGTGFPSIWLGWNRQLFVALMACSVRPNGAPFKTSIPLPLTIPLEVTTTDKTTLPWDFAAHIRTAIRNMFLEIADRQQSALLVIIAAP